MNEPTPVSLISEQLSAILGSAPFGIMAVNAEGLIVGSNESAAEVVSRSVDTLVGSYVVDLLADPGDSPLLDETFRTAIGGTRVRRSFRISVDGILRMIDMQCWAETTGSGIPLALVLVETAAEHDQVAQLKELISKSPTGLARLTSDKSMVDVNDRWTDITGQPIEDAAGLGWLEQVDIDGRSDFVAALGDALANREGIRGRLRLVTVDGEIRWIDVSTTPLDAPRGALVLVRGFDRRIRYGPPGRRTLPSPRGHERSCRDPVSRRHNVGLAQRSDARISCRGSHRVAIRPPSRQILPGAVRRRRVACRARQRQLER